MNCISFVIFVRHYLTISIQEAVLLLNRSVIPLLPEMHKVSCSGCVCALFSALNFARSTFSTIFFACFSSCFSFKFSASIWATCSESSRMSFVRLSEGSASDSDVSVDWQLPRLVALPERPSRELRLTRSSRSVVSEKKDRLTECFRGRGTGKSLLKYLSGLVPKSF